MEEMGEDRKNAWMGVALVAHARTEVALMTEDRAEFELWGAIRDMALGKLGFPTFEELGKAAAREAAAFKAKHEAQVRRAGRLQ